MNMEAIVVISVLFSIHCGAIRHAESSRTKLKTVLKKSKFNSFPHFEPARSKLSLLDESDFKWAYQSASEDDSCGGEPIIGTATPLNKCFTSYIGGNIDRPSGSQMFVCDGSEF